MHMTRIAVGPALVGLITLIALATQAKTTADDAPPPIPYGTQEMLKLNAIVNAAPFMAASTDRVVALKQERLRNCVKGLEYRFGSYAAGIDQSLVTLADVVHETKTSWLALCSKDEQKMPILEFVLQLAEDREKSSQALFEQGRLSAMELLAAKRNRMTAEIEMIECQRAASGPR